MKIAVQIRCFHNLPLYPWPLVKPAFPRGRDNQDSIWEGISTGSCKCERTLSMWNRRVLGEELRRGCSLKNTSSAARRITSSDAPFNCSSSFSHWVKALPSFGSSSMRLRSSSAAEIVQIVVSGRITDLPSPSMWSKISLTSFAISMSGRCRVFATLAMSICPSYRSLILAVSQKALEVARKPCVIFWQLCGNRAFRS